jgi:DNA mismatch repair protein MutS
VLNHARHVLQALESKQSESQSQVDLFNVPVALEIETSSALESALTALNPDNLSPKEALEALYSLKKLL